MPAIKSMTAACLGRTSRWPDRTVYSQPAVVERRKGSRRGCDRVEDLLRPRLSAEA